MAAHVLKNVEVRFGGKDISGISNQATLNYSADLQDSTVFADTTRQRKAGLLDVSLALEAFFDDTDESDKDFFDQISATTEAVLSIVPESSVVGSEAYISEQLQATFNHGGAIGELLPISAEFQGDSPLVKATILQNGIVTASGESAGQNLGALADVNEKMYAILHVTNSGGDTSQTIDVTIVSDDDGSFDSLSTTRITFAQVTTTVDGELLLVVGPITGPHWRAEWVVAGTGSPTFTIFVAIGKTTN